MRIYLDSAIIIYAVEQVMPYASIVETRLLAPDILYVTSDLARMECRVKPLQTKDIEMLKDYDYYQKPPEGDINKNKTITTTSEG